MIISINLERELIKHKHHLKTTIKSLMNEVKVEIQKDNLMHIILELMNKDIALVKDIIMIIIMIIKSKIIKDKIIKTIKFIITIIKVLMNNIIKNLIII